MNPIITLTTDFGTRDGFVGAMKGRILSITPHATIVDITHEVPAQDVLQASWTLYRSTIQFPAESIHIAVIDPGVGSERPAILVKSEGRWYVGPDNGIFTRIIEQCGTDEIYEINKQTDLWQAHSSFDGLALFAPVGAHLAAGLKPNQIGSPPQKTLKILRAPSPEASERSIDGEIILFDRFGNAITNVMQYHIEALLNTQPTVMCKSQRFPKVSFYHEGELGSGVSIINSDGNLEISVPNGSAREQYDLEIGDKVSIK